MGPNRFFKTGAHAVVLVVLLGCLPLVCAACKLYTVVKLNQDESKAQGIKVYFENDNFNAAKYVDNIWKSKVIPYIIKKAGAADRVLAELAKDPDAAGSHYGFRASEEGIPWNLMIKGKGKIAAVNTASRAGTVALDLPPYDGKKEITLQIGPVIKGSSIRDSLSFISFDDFENQIVFAQLSNAFNKKVNDQLLAKTDFAKLKGREIEFTGVFTADGSNDLLVTPVVLKTD